jgi:sentrin-specific protease 8
MKEGGLGRLQKRMRGRFGDMLSPDDAYLSYHDIRLTREDMQTLKNDWLTDNVGDMELSAGL